MDGQSQLNRQDLMLMMDSYKNSVEMYTIIVEQLKGITSQVDKLGTGHSEILENQEKIIPLVHKVLEDMITNLTTQREMIARILSEIKTFNKESFEELQDEMGEKYKSISDKIDNVAKELQKSNEDHIKTDGKFQVRFNRLYAALSGIVLALIGAVATAYAKMIDLNTIIIILTKIAEKLGIILK